MIGNVMAVLSFLIGLVIVTNPYLPFIDQHARWTDLLALLSVPIILLYIPSTKRLHWMLPGAFLIFVLELPWLWTDIKAHGFFGGSLSLRWLALTLLAVSVDLLHRRGQSSASFALGIFVGGPVNCLLLWLQSAGFTDELTKLGLAYPGVGRVFAGGPAMERFAGLHGHPNAAAAVIGLCIPAALTLNVQFKKSWLWVAGAVMVCIAGAWLTYSRSPFMIAAFLLLTWLLKLRLHDKRLLVLGFALLAAGFVAASEIPSLSARWTTDDSAEANAAIRLDTTVRSAQASLQSPLGLGSDFEDDMPRDLLATHNAFTHLALTAGIPLALLVFTCLLVSAAMLRRRADLNGWLGLYLLGIFFFEEHLRNPTFVLLTVWLVLANIRSFIKSILSAQKRRAANPSHGFRLLHPAAQK
jgi:hypothetical protein